MSFLRTLCTVCFLGFATLSHAQDFYDLVFRLDQQVGEPDERQERYLREISRSAYSMDEQGWDRDSLVTIKISDLHAFSRTLRHWRDGVRWEATYADGTTQTLTARQWSIRRQLIDQYREYQFYSLPRRLQGASEREQNKYVRKKVWKFLPALMGWKRKSINNTPTWYINLGERSGHASVTTYRVDMLTRNSPYVAIYFDTLRADFVRELPMLDEANCSSLDRYTRFLEMQEATFNAFRYRPYRAQDRVRRRQRYALFFEKNKTGYDQAETQEIVDFLRDSSFQVAKAYVRGMASVEGDSANNIRLMEARAQVLVNTLQRHQEEAIELETETYENWPLFYQQLHKEGHDTTQYSKAEWKDLFLEDSVSDAVEPMLALQRRADVTLYMYQLLDEVEQVDHTFREYRRTLTMVARARTPREKGRQLVKLISIRQYLEEQARVNKISWETLDMEAPVWGAVPDEVPVVYAIHLINQKKDGAWIPDDFDARVMSGHHAAIRLMANNEGEILTYFTKQAASLQIYIFNQIAEYQFGAQRLCEMRYPEAPLYYPLILNYYHFLENNLTARSLPCGASGRLNGPEGDLWVSTQPILSSYGMEDSINTSTIDPRHSRYYYYLKNWLLSKDPELAKYVNRVGDYFMFDLLEVVSTNIYGWNIKDGVMFDSDIDITTLDALINELYTYRNQICPTNLMPVILEYHLRLQQFCLIHPEFLTLPENQKLLRRSIEFVSNYYTTRKARMTPSQAHRVALHLNAVATQYMGNGLAHDAWEIMEVHANRQQLADEPWARDYANLAVMVGDSPFELITELTNLTTPATRHGWLRQHYQVHPQLWQRFGAPDIP